MAGFFATGAAAAFAAGVVQFAINSYLPGSLCYVAAGLFAVAAAILNKSR